MIFMGIEERKHRDRERRIKEILTAARELFLKKGIIRTSMMDIAERSDLSRRTLYLYFTSKDEIALSIVFDGLSKIMQRLIDNTQNKANGWEKFCGMKDAYLGYYEEDYNSFHSTFKIYSLINSENIDSHEVKKCLSKIREITDFVTEVLKNGILDGSLSPQKDVTITAISLMNMVHSSMERLSHKSAFLNELAPHSGNDVIEATFQLLLAGLRNIQATKESD